MSESRTIDIESRMTEQGTGFPAGEKARRQAYAFLSNYTSDVSGVCSALYELGGMVVMHDPSGCNSTYNTHDEPRWYEKDSLIFISGLSQIDAILGNDDKLIDDIVRAARDLHPAFIALVRTPIPMMTGTDFEAIARIVEQETGIPVWYFPTSGMNSYVRGAGMAMERAVRHLAVQGPAAGEIVPDPEGVSGNRPVRVNVLGVTPLDFSINSSRESLQHWLHSRGFILQSMLAMGDKDAETLRCQIQSAGLADVNLVVSSAGLPAARVLKERFGMPYVIGLPCSAFGEVIYQALYRALSTGEDQKSLFMNGPEGQTKGKYIIGEPVIALSLASTAWMEQGESFQVICPLELDEDLAEAGCLVQSSEEDLIRTLRQGKKILADPIYQRICPLEAAFYPFPHEAYSGRIYRRQMPDLMTGIREIEPPADRRVAHRKTPTVSRNSRVIAEAITIDSLT